MSNPENRKRPHVWHASPEINGLIRVYAAKRGVTPNEAAEELIQGNVGTIVDAAAEIKKLRAAVTRAENVALTREIQRDDAIADCAAERKAHTATRADLESAREATRRADAEVERLTRELAASQARERQADDAAMNARDDLAEERLASKGLDETLRNARAQIAALTRELAEVRAASATKGATDRLAERVETIAAALPDDFEAKLAERAPGWKGTLPELRARVITLGFSRYDALATDAAKRAAERGR